MLLQTGSKDALCELLSDPPKRTLSKLHSQGTLSKLQDIPNGSPSKLKTSTGFTWQTSRHPHGSPSKLQDNPNGSTSFHKVRLTYPQWYSLQTLSHPQSFSSQTPNHSNVLSENSFEVFSSNIPRSSHFLCLIPKLGIKSHSLLRGARDQTTPLLKVSLKHSGRMSLFKRLGILFML